jgi:PPOX class probable F420-dependent enzyme
MSVPFSVDHREFFEEANLACVITLEADGTPQAQPVWFNVEGDALFVNSREGRKWPDRLRHDNRVTILVVSSSNPANYIQVTGRAVELTHTGAQEHINVLAHRYMGIDYPFGYEGEQRVLIKVEPQHIIHIDANLSAAKAQLKAVSDEADATHPNIGEESR